MADLLPDNETQLGMARPARDADADAGLTANQAAAGGTAAPDRPHGFPGEAGSPLFPPEQCKTLGDEWQNIQAGFVDAPRISVQKADALVTKTVGILQTSFADMHNGLERNWEKDKEVSTEDLRVALQNYRSFFQRLLSL